MNVLSLFDGMSCGQIALNKANIQYENYFASEIDKDAIFITQKNYPKTKQIGDVNLITKQDFNEPIDLLIGGSPCQNLSMQTINNLKHNKGLEGEKSGLFYQYLRLLNELKPKYFFLENVGGMTKENKNLITYALGVDPVCINSNLLTAQDRNRYYWTNIKASEITDLNINLKDIVQPAEEVAENFWYKQSFDYKGDLEKVQAILHINGHDILKRVYNLEGKCGTLTCCRGGNTQKKVLQYLEGKYKARKLTPLEYERLQSVPDNYTFGVSNSQRWNMLGNGWTVDVIAEFFKHLKPATDFNENLDF